MLSDGAGDKCPKCGKASMPKWAPEGHEVGRKCQDPDCGYEEDRSEVKHEAP